MELIVAIIIALVIYAIQVKLYRELWNEHLNVTLRFQDSVIRAGEESSLIEVVHNNKSLPMPVFHVKFSCSKSFVFEDMENSYITDSYHRNDVFSILGYQRITRTLNFTAQQRGYYELAFVHLLTRDFFLLNRFAEKIENETAITILPKRRKEEMVDIAFQSIYGDFVNPHSLLEDPFSFRGIREYDRRDSFHKINWKATAKTGDLMVNVYDHASEQQVCILFNLETNTMIHVEELQEVAIEIVGTLVEKFVDKAVSVSFQSNGVDILSQEYSALEMGCSNQHILAMDMVLARIGENAGLDYFLELLEKEKDKQDRSISYVIVSSYCKENMMRVVDDMRNCGLAVHMICPYFDIQRYEQVRPYVHGVEIKLEKSATDE